MSNAVLRLLPSVAQIFPIYFEVNNALCNALVFVRLCGLKEASLVPQTQSLQWTLTGLISRRNLFDSSENDDVDQGCRQICASGMDLYGVAEGEGVGAYG